MSYPPTAQAAQETKGQPPSCYDFQHKPNFHSLNRQRYVSPTTGKCRWLRVQCASSTQSSPIRGATHGKEVDVSGGARRALKLAYWLAQHSPFSEYFPEWVGRWLWLILCLLTWVKSAPYEDTYKPYLSKFWGQLWAARSEKEYSLRVPGRGLLLRQDHKGDVYSITHAAYPRQLIVHDGTDWRVCIDPNALARMEYIAISYKNSDFTTPQIDGNYEVTKEVQQSYVSALARSICLALGATAYWLDFECTGGLQAEKNKNPDLVQAEKNEDLYRFADVFRGASRTVILIRDRYLFPLNSTEIPSRTKQQRDEEEASGWKSWGERVWTFPEALLSSELAYKFGSEPVRSISLREVGNIAYGPDQEEMRLINGFSGKDPLERIERLALLKNAIWRRSSASSPAPHSPQKVTPGTGRPFTAFPAERVYALMGFFEHRIMPDNQESVWHALARLSMANDSDHLVERMIAMLPRSIPDRTCWYSDEDIFGAKLWDIDPEVQVAGITSSGALVLDGCRAAAIRWKDFPEVASLLKPSFRRAICAVIPQIFAYVLLIGLFCLGASVAIGVIMVVMALLVLLLAPKLLVYGNTGMVLIARPWLVGIKGFMSAEQVGVELYGCVAQERDFPTIAYSSSGSILAHPSKSLIRGGDPTQSEYAASRTPNVYTLVDTVANQVYYFTAARPPTVCLYLGREGGLGRFALCSESCNLNELHKETVLRMPSYIANSMTFCDWLAVGGLDSKKGI